MPRILAACLAVFLTANGWAAAPVVSAKRIHRAAYSFDRGTGGVRYQQPSLFLPQSAIARAQQTPEPVAETIVGYRPPDVETPSAPRLRQRPPPQNF